MKWFNIILLPVIMVVVLQSTVLAATVSPNLKVSGRVPEWETTITSHGGKLLLSDSPETVTSSGIMYQDVVEGESRLFFHHVNGTSSPKKVIVLLENATDKMAHVTVSQYGLAGPGANYLEIGKEVQMNYMKGEDIYLLEVPAKGSTSLIPTLEQTVVKPQMLINGMYDFETDAPVNVKVMMMPIDADFRTFATTAKVLPPDVGEYRLRGTFEGKDRLVVAAKAYNPQQDGIVGITLADNDVDEYVSGIDATDGTPTINYGNYGIMYKMFVPTAANGPVSYYLNPRGGEYAGYIGVKYRHQELYNIATPSDKISFGKGTVHDSSYISSYEGGKSVWFTFSPPGASNLPIKLIMTPTKI